MKNISCNVIKDLLPSYLDNICSEDSRMLIEEHLKDCEDCKQALKEMSSEEHSIKTVSAPGSNVLLNLQSSLAKKDQLTALLFLCAIILCPCFLAYYAGHLSLVFYAVLLPIALFGFYLILGNGNSTCTKKETLFLIPLPLCSLFVLAFSYYAISAGDNSFLEISKIGPFMSTILYLFLLGNIAMLLYFLVTQIRKRVFSLLAYASGLTGTFLSLSYLTTLYNMDSFDSYMQKTLSHTGVIYVECLIFLAIAFIIRHKKAQNI